MTDETEHSTPSRAQEFRRGLTVAVFLTAAWLLWSGLFKPLLLDLGTVSVLITLYILQRMGYFSNETFAFRYSPRLVGFWVWLGKEIVVSSLIVTRIVLQRRISVDPQLVELDASDLDALDQALLGNSITLTPGTLTLDVHKNRILVHAITSETAVSLEQGEMMDRVRALKDD